jgi:hypothetical protein
MGRGRAAGSLVGWVVGWVVEWAVAEGVDFEVPMIGRVFGGN